MSRQTRFALTLAALTLAPAGAAAQGYVPFSRDITWAWPTSLGTSGTLNRTVCGDVTGDARKDLFVRGGPNGNAITFFNAPGESAGSLAISPTCNDFDIAPKASALGLDALVYVNSGGLKRLDFDPALGNFPSAGVTISSTSSWQGATMVRSADVNGTTVADYVGLASNTNLRTICYRRDTSPGVFTESTFLATSQVKDIQLVRWVTGQPLAVAIRLANGFEVRTLATGVLQSSFTFSNTVADAIAVLPTGGTDVERIALLTRHNGGTEILRIFKQASALTELEVLIDNAAGLVAVSMGVSDMDADGDYDIALNWNNVDSPRVFMNTGGTGSASPAFSVIDQETVTWTEIGIGTPVFPNAAQITFKDVDNNGWADLLLPLRSQYGSSLEGRLVCLKRLGPGAPGDRGACGAFPSPSNPELSDSPYFDFATNFSLGMPIADTLGLGASARRVEITVWRQGISNPLLTSAPTDPGALKHYLVSIESFYTSGVSYPVLRATGIALGLTSPHEGCLSDEVRFVEFREVIVDGTGKPVDAGPTYTLALTAWVPMKNALAGETPLCRTMFTSDTCDEGSDGETGCEDFVRPRRPGPPTGVPVTVPTGSPIPSPGGVQDL